MFGRFVPVLLAFGAALLAAPAAATPAGADALVASARPHIIALPGLDPAASPASATAVEALVGDARVVSLGEPAHGLHEPLAFRNALFRMLVEREGFTAIALETGFTEARRVDDYVQGGPGDPRRVAAEGLTWGFGNLQENVALIEWIRAYNLDPRHDRKIRFYGMDVSGNAVDGRVPIDSVLAYLDRAAGAAAAGMRAQLVPFLPRLNPEAYRSLTPSGRTALAAAFQQVDSFLTTRRDLLAGASSPEDLEWARRNLAVARALEKMFSLWPEEDATSAVPPGFYKAADARDVAMADNLLWILGQEGASGRVLVFGHNAHIGNAPVQGGLWNVYPQAPRAMGQHLREALGEDLRIIAVSAGSARGTKEEAFAPPGSLDLLLSRIDPGNFLLDLRPAIADPDAMRWLGRMQTLRTNMNSEMELVPATAADAILHLGAVTRAAPANARTPNDDP